MSLSEEGYFLLSRDFWESRDTSFRDDVTHSSDVTPSSTSPQPFPPSYLAIDNIQQSSEPSSGSMVTKHCLTPTSEQSLDIFEDHSLTPSPVTLSPPSSIVSRGIFLAYHLPAPAATKPSTPSETESDIQFSGEERSEWSGYEADSGDSGVYNSSEGGVEDVGGSTAANRGSQSILSLLDLSMNRKDNAKDKNREAWGIIEETELQDEVKEELVLEPHPQHFSTISETSASTDLGPYSSPASILPRPPSQSILTVLSLPHMYVSSTKSEYVSAGSETWHTPPNIITPPAPPSAPPSAPPLATPLATPTRNLNSSEVDKRIEAWIARCYCDKYYKHLTTPKRKFNEKVKDCE